MSTIILNAFLALGDFLSDFYKNYNAGTLDRNDEFVELLHRTRQQNGWFTEDHVLFALQQWATLLTEENLTRWLHRYIQPEDHVPKTVGLVMSGNIPLVSFYDFVCVLLAGHTVIAKRSSQDNVLFPFLSHYLIQQEPTLAQKIQFVEGTLKNIDAIIVTGSNTMGDYFERYFSKRPSILRRNRNAVAILTGNESAIHLSGLGNDIFRYYGLGRRNVSKIYVPEGYDFDVFFNAMYTHKEIINHHKYANNYDYNKAVYLMSDRQILDNGFLILKEDKGFSSPIATLFYQYYDSETTLRQQLQAQKAHIECVVSEGTIPGDLAFGETQKPQLHDYADGVDIMNFLLQL